MKVRVGTPFYTLDATGEPVPCEDTLAWAAWFEKSDETRVVAKTELPSGATVSTVFLGIDHAFGGGDPVLWETITFGGEYDLACDRYRSKKDAIVGHEMWVLVAKGEMTPIDARRLKAQSEALVPSGHSSREKKRKEPA